VSGPFIGRSAASLKAETGRIKGPDTFFHPGIAAGPNGNLWFTENATRQIGEYFLTGTPPATAYRRYFI